MTSCSYHASKDAAGSCVTCGKLICIACQSEIDGKSYCPPCVEKLFTASEAKAQATLELAAAKPEARAVNPAWWLLPVFLSWVGGLAAWLANKEHNAGMARYMLFTGIGLAVVQGLVGLIVVVVLMAAPPAGTGNIATGPRVPTVTQSPTTLPVNPGQEPPANLSFREASAGDTVSPRSAGTGDITTGPKVQAASQTIDSAGGSIAVTKPGDPLDGFVIGVPPNSYADSRTFKVSYAPITNQTFGSDITPVSPMISVDNGGGYSDGMMYVRVPVKVPEDSFAMGFIYDGKTKQLEGMELVGSDAESVTVATRHFSDFFVSMIKKALLKEDINSGFQPGKDDWQFPNNGSYIAPVGHCEGQSLTAIWYYCTRPDGQDKQLYARYDNNGNKPATPTLWQDDSLGYRFCSVIQNETRFGKNISIGAATLDDFWDNLAGRAWDGVNAKWINVPRISDGATFNLFEYTIRATGQPQEVAMRSNAGDGHAMVVYKVVGNTLYVADPNFQGKTEQEIIYNPADGKFTPYRSGANSVEIAKGHVTVYENILYYEKSTIVPWDVIAQHWAEFKAGKIGNDKFPAYTIEYKDDKGKWQALKDGYVSPLKTIDMQVSFVGVAAPGICSVYRDGAELIRDDKGNYELKPGENLLGIYVQGKVGTDNMYVDFKYIKVIYGAQEQVTTACKYPMPAAMLAQLHKTTQFKCMLLKLPGTVDGRGSMNKWVPGFFKSWNFWVPGNSTDVNRDFQGEGELPGSIYAMDIKWSGTSFSGGGDNGYPDKLTGDVCYSNGDMLVSFDYSTNVASNNLKMSVKNVPMDAGFLMKVRPNEAGPELRYNTNEAQVAKGFVTGLEWKSHEEKVEHEYVPNRTLVWDASFKDPDWTAGCGFSIDIFVPRSKIPSPGI